MAEAILEKLVSRIYLPRFRKLEDQIGCGLTFHNIPDRYINGWMRWGMTKTWKKFGLNVGRGANYFTMGRVVGGVSSRFDKNASEYQSWLGGYTAKLIPGRKWSVEDHFKLAIADQNNWLRMYGDPSPMTSIEGWKFTMAGEVKIGRYSGVLYEGGCTTHSDVGTGRNSIKLRLACAGMAAVFNLSNPKLKLKGEIFKPKTIGDSYEILKLRGYIAIFEIGENTKVVLYANGTEDTFGVLKNDLLDTIKSCEIIKRLPS